MNTYFLHISPDLLQASVHSLSGRTGDKVLAPAQSLSEQLTEENIVYGLDTAAIERVEAARAQTGARVFANSGLNDTREAVTETTARDYNRLQAQVGVRLPLR